MIGPLTFDASVAGFVGGLARASALAFTAPLLGDRGTSSRVRLVFAVAVAAVLAGRHQPGEPADAMALAAVPLEAGAGALAGVTARLVLDRAATGGQLIGVHAGLGFAQAYDPSAGESATSVRALVATIAGLAFLAADGLEALVRAAAVPVTSLTLEHGLTGAATAALAVMAAAIGVAAPVLLAATVVNLGLAFVNRAAPAVNVFSVSLPVVLLVAGAALLATAPLTAGAIDRVADAAVAGLVGGRP